MHPAGDRSLEYVDAVLRGERGEAFELVTVVRARFDPRASGSEPGEDPSLAGQDLGDRGGRRQAGEDAVGSRRDLPCRARPGRARPRRAGRPRSRHGRAPSRRSPPAEGSRRAAGRGCRARRSRASAAAYSCSRLTSGERETTQSHAIGGPRAASHTLRLSMHAIVFTAAGGNEVVRLEERPDPVPSGCDVLVAVRYAALNPADMAQREGRYPAPPGSPPDVPGSRGGRHRGRVRANSARRSPRETGSSASSAAAGSRAGCSCTSCTSPRCRRASTSSRLRPCRRSSSRRTTRS